VGTQSGEVMVENLLIDKEAREYRASFYLFDFSNVDIHEKTIPLLHAKELEMYRSLKFERRIRSYLAGRYAAKRAVSLYLKENDLTQIFIDQGVFTQPVVVHSKHVQTSITHCENLAAAVAFPEKLPMGIDIEQIRPGKLEVLESQATRRETSFIRSLPYSNESMLTLLWSVKEALSKVLKTGLTTPFHIFELKRIEIKDGFFLSSYENFYQYETVSFLFQPFVCSIAYPKGVELNTDPMKKGLYKFACK
jgi:phosphopantetheinyl transferase